MMHESEHEALESSNEIPWNGAALRVLTVRRGGHPNRSSVVRKYYTAFGSPLGWSGEFRVPVFSICGGGELAEMVHIGRRFGT